MCFEAMKFLNDMQYMQPLYKTRKYELVLLYIIGIHQINIFSFLFFSIFFTSVPPTYQVFLFSEESARCHSLASVIGVTPLSQSKIDKLVYLRPTSLQSATE